MTEDQIHAMEPGRLTGLAVTMVQVRGAVSLEREKRRTMTQLADCLSGHGQAGQVTHRDPLGGEWTITVVPAAAADNERGSRLR
ncbi:hypothetical protein [Streptomyces sp. NPDC093094]|uniref:hypothetical protein n=1 Tax=Streptomyces sp. NPDC093094 TaxID=3366026 RepID=UPI0037F6E78E